MTDSPNHRRRGLTVLVAVPLLLGSGVSVAQAAPTVSVTSFPPNCPSATKQYSYDGGAMVCFQPTGEHLFVCDMKKDGFHPAAWYQGTYDVGYTKKDNYGAYGSCLDVNLDMDDDDPNAKIRYFAYNYDSHHLKSSSDVSNWFSPKG